MLSNDTVFYAMIPSFLQFLRNNPDQPVNYNNQYDCVFASYLKSQGYQNVRVLGYEFDYNGRTINFPSDDRFAMILTSGSGLQYRALIPAIESYLADNIDLVRAALDATAKELINV